ncbi:MAG: hypothetical protein IJU20_02590 [Clostridia bacterium]|nr:hypothetical protein [Clostridia bacterium]
MKALRILCAVLALVMLVAVFAACGNNAGGPEKGTNGSGTKESGNSGSKETGGSSNPDETSGESSGEKETDPEDPFVYTDLPDDIDLGGFNFNIYYSRRGLNIVNVAEDKTGDIIEDALFDSTSYVTEKYNCTITAVEKGGDQEFANAVKVSAQNGDKDFSLSIGHDTLTINNALSGYYLDIKSLQTPNFDKPWWPKDAMDSISIGKKLYAAVTHLSYSSSANANMIVYNRMLANDKNIEIPYPDIWKGTWYLSKMIDMSKEGYNDANADGTIQIEDGETYGFLCGVSCTFSLQAGWGVLPVLKDEDDLPYYGLDGERAFNFLQAFEELTGPGSGSFIKANNSDHVAMFKENGSLFIISNGLSVYKDLRGIDGLSYGYLPVPKFDESQEDYASCGSDILWALAAAQEENKEKIAVIVEELSCQNYNNVIPAFFESTLKTKLSESPEDMRVVEIVRDTYMLPFAYFYNTRLGGSASMSELPRYTTSSTVSSYIGDNWEALDGKIKDLIELLGTLN